MQSGLDELAERGFIQQCSDLNALTRIMADRPVTFYVGFDPTGESLHAGHLVPVFAMAHLARAGHKPIALIGSGTARIGDPSGKTEIRKMLTVKQIQHNAGKIRRQIEHFLERQGLTAEIVDNADWLADLNYIEFLRDIGRHFSVNRMLSFETYRQRLETGLTFIEFNYQLLQSYDYLVLHRERDCRLQVGGDDQWGNIVAGIDLIRRVTGNECYALTFPLVTRADGKKMGKTEQGAVYLDRAVYSPYSFYQYFRNVPDADVERFLGLYTFLPVAEVRRLGRLTDAEINEAKEVLAFELTKAVHGESEAQRAREAAWKAFGGSAEGGTEAIPTLTVPKSELEQGIGVLDLFSRTELCSSRSEARRLVSQGGASINDIKIESPDTLIDASWMLEEVLMLRAGKKRYFRIQVSQ